MPFDVNGARQYYSDPEILAYLSYSSGEPIEDLPGTDEDKIWELMRRRDRSMLPVEYAEQTPGLLTPGNIDLHARPVVRNPDGSISTVRSASFEENGREVLVPTVSDDGRILTDDQAWQQYRQTGRHLGKFRTPQQATAYAQQLHEAQAQEYAETPFSRAVAQPPEPPPAALSRPDPSLQIEPVDPVAMLPSWLQGPGRTLSEMNRPFSMPVSGGTPFSGTEPDVDIGGAVYGMRDLLEGPSLGERAGGLSTLLRTGMQTAAPLVLPAVARAPMQTLTGLASGMAMGGQTEQGLRNLGVHPGYAALGGDVAGLGFGFGTATLPWQNLSTLAREPNLLRGALRELGTSDLGEITIGPSKGWTSTLRDLIEAKAPGKVQPEQLRSIAGQAPAEEVRWSNLAELTGQPSALSKGEVLEGFKQPEITEILRTPPDTKYGSFTLPGGEKSSELLLQLGSPSRYRSGHWDEPNVFAHTRFNERTTPAGERVLLLEEVQSDWHQAGRKEGYIGPEQDRAALKQKRDDLRAQIEAKRPDFDAGRIPQEEFSRAYEEYNQADHAYRQSLLGLAGGVPDAPFKKDWHELVMKRMLREAVDQGYDKLAWTTGEQQAERYDLSKHLNEIRYESKGEGSAGEPLYKFVAIDKHGDGVINESGIGLDRIEELVGKEIAEKIRDGQGTDVETAHRKWRALSGLDLKVGGEGMRGFYDKMLPDFARRYGKKFGSTVSQSEIEVPGFNQTYEGATWTAEELRQLSQSLGIRQQMHVNKILYEMEGGKTFEQAMAMHGSEPLAQQLHGRLIQKPKTATVHSMDITPAMREAIRKGQPMFGSAARTTTKQERSLRELAQ